MSAPISPTALRPVSLDDKYTCPSGRIYLTGIQALVRLPLMQRQRDTAAGLNTAGFISGYRGSPLGGLDKALWQAGAHLRAHHIHFQPGLNEDLAATAVWGSQQLPLFPAARYDGVFGLWYGKGPGVDRSCDVFKHANGAGASHHGGVLAVAGDDPGCKSSTFPHQSEHAFMHAMIPELYPAGVQELLDIGLIGWAMSRYSGCWIAFKTVAETMDSSVSVQVDPERVRIAHPDPADFPLPPGGLNIRWPDPPLEQEERLMRYKLYAALAFARANRLDQVVIAAHRPRLGIVTTGKSYLDVRQALDELSITPVRADELGLTVYKVLMPWPLEREGVRHFAEGLEEILVVEEKRAIIENQLKEQLYNWHPDVRPRVVGKFDEQARWLLPSYGELSPGQIAIVIGQRLLNFAPEMHWLAERVAFLTAHEQQKSHPPHALRKPHYCSGCPHNSSTVVPEGSRALGGIGCHYMATWMDRRTDTFSQMGGEGVPWIGQAPFTDTTHVFANLGDGTYYHSGSLAIRAAVAAGVNITYKILYNDAVAMTGGQAVDGPLSVAAITRQMAAEGVARIVVVSDQPQALTTTGFAPYVTIEPREALERVQRELRHVKGVSILLYVQTCAAEKRRRRKRGTLEDPARRVVINARVCEGCGDCSAKSNCLSVIPRDTIFGRKRQIDQSSCNKDFSCVRGLCPSFVMVEGGRLRPPQALALPPSEQDDGLRPDAGTGTGTDAGTTGADTMPDAALPSPPPPSLAQPWNLYVTGVGGTGVVTIGALLGMAAHLEDKGCSVLDMTGLAQKGGAVTSHVRIAATPEALHAVRIAAGAAHVVIGCDLVVAAAGDALAKMAPGITRALINRHPTITADFIHNPGHTLPVEAMLADIRAACGDAVAAIDATHLATALLGDSIATNLFMLGYAWQKGLVPVSAAAIRQAIVLNGTAVQLNTLAFAWGRRAGHDLEAVEALVAETPTGRATAKPANTTLDEHIALRIRDLEAYQDAAYAGRYQRLVQMVRHAEASTRPGVTTLTAAVARVYYQLLAYKDEYEVARLYSDDDFLREIKAQFTGDYQLKVLLAPPLLARLNPDTGEPEKKAYGPWVFRLFRLLARGKRLRGTWMDPFGWLPERRRERQWITIYEQTIGELLSSLTPARHPLAVEIATLPEGIRGFGPVKERNAQNINTAWARAMDRFRTSPPE